MIKYIPFIHKEKKKTEPELQPLYAEITDPSLLPPVYKQEEEKIERGFVIIDL